MKKQKLTLISIIALILIGYITILAISAVNRLNESKNIQSKNLNIGGVFGVNLGDSIESINNNKEFEEVSEYPDLYKYNYIVAKVKNTKYQSIYFHALPESNVIYKIVYDTDDTKCDNLRGTFNKLRTIYGIGNYSFFDAFGDLKVINKDNKSIKVLCSSAYLTGKASENIIYLDDELKNKLQDEYITHKNKKLDSKTRFN